MRVNINEVEHWDGDQKVEVMPTNSPFFHLALGGGCFGSALQALDNSNLEP